LNLLQLSYLIDIDITFLYTHQDKFSEVNICGMCESIFVALGGYLTIEKVHKIFYDKVFSHDWLKQYFVNQDQSLIEKQQTNFMAEKMGGPKNYVGKLPRQTHIHMYITEELFNLRHELLKNSLEEAKVPRDLIERWLRIDYAFKRLIVDESLETFHASYTFKRRIIVPNPSKDQSS